VCVCMVWYVYMCVRVRVSVRVRVCVGVYHVTGDYRCRMPPGPDLPLMLGLFGMHCFGPQKNMGPAPT
jgi:hypothetical protein